VDDDFIKGLKELKKADPNKVIEVIFSLFHSIEKMGYEKLVAAKRSIKLFRSISDIDDSGSKIITEMEEVMICRAAVIYNSAGSLNYTCGPSLFSSFGEKLFSERIDRKYKGESWYKKAFSDHDSFGYSDIVLYRHPKQMQGKILKEDELIDHLSTTGISSRCLSIVDGQKLILDISSYPEEWKRKRIFFFNTQTYDSTTRHQFYMVWQENQPNIIRKVDNDGWGPDDYIAIFSTE
jgi:hypothetical protein